MNQVIKTDIENQVLTLTLNRPEKHNCINWDMLRQLQTILSEAETSNEVRVIVVRGAGDRAFSTGAD